MKISPEPKNSEQMNAPAAELTQEQIEQAVGGAEFGSPRLDDPQWQSDVPKPNDAGEYSVYWYVDGDQNYDRHCDPPIDAGEYKVQISPKTLP